MLHKLTSLPSFVRLALCLALSVGLHGGLVLYEWLSPPAGNQPFGKPVEISLVSSAEAFPARPTPSQDAIQKTVAPAKAKKKSTRREQAVAAKPVVRPPALEPSMQKPSEVAVKNDKAKVDEDATADLVCVAPVKQDEADMSIQGEAVSDAVQPVPVGAALDAEETGVMQGRRGEQASLAERLVEAVPDYRNNPLPKYPYIARQRRWEGVVWLRVDVTSDGKVGDLEIEQSCGYKALDRAAIKSVRHWEFTPALRAGLPVESRVRIPVRFRLEDG